VVGLLVVTVFTPSSLNGIYLTLAEVVNLFAILIVLVTEVLLLLSKLKRELREMLLKPLAPLGEDLVFGG
jgi:hypothetical protein